uniref:Xrn1 N-terminal domain-containing protein n=1 Tax=viral metagenome TaxID=1070528 RepID=A0A6C0F5J8_9ZZZZ|tara:strand:+ start:9994 stop:11733 length:1740 start_codon:yes stop_codon:yes gene_type:complete
MGIPSLFRTVIEKYHDIHYWDANLQVDQLYLDYNCLIHYCKSKVNITSTMSLRDIEEELIAEVIKYTSYIVTQIVKPKKFVFIAIDGSVPMGKMVKQRQRRYKKVQDDVYKRKLKHRYNIETKLEFDGNKITPGTPFMSKLASRIKNFAMIGAFSKHIKNPTKQYKVFISDANLPGEGEQKIMQFIRNGSPKLNGESPSMVIYGLDADLIMLSMQLQKNVKLLREPQNTSVEIQSYSDSEFIYFDVDKCADCLIKDFNLSHYDRKQIIDDIIFITFFGGNDFVEPFVHTKMRDNGLDKILTAYTKGLPQHIMQDNILNIDAFITFLINLGSIEDIAVKKLAVKAKGSGSMSRKPKGKLTPQQQYEFDVQLYEHSFYTETCNPFHTYYQSLYNLIDFKDLHINWKAQYNNYYFNSSVKSTIVMDDFVRCLSWTWKYYNQDNCPSWLWVFKHRNAPLCSDFLEYMQNLSETKFNDLWNSVDLDDSPLSPIEQLIAVLPPQNAGLLPFAFQIIMKDPELKLQHKFPPIVKLDVVKGLKNIYSEPILPDIDVQFINKMMYCIPVSEPELCRNILRDKLFCFKI